MAASDAPTPPGNASAVVLDTNAVLDWLLFANPALNPWARAIQARQLRWLACPRMQHELLATAGKSSLAKWNPDSERMLTHWADWVEMRPDPPTPPAEPLRCTDADDQVFLDLALAEGARWLVTRDRALLKLARRAAPRGLLIVIPEQHPA
jgi:uncharacterized protein